MARTGKVEISGVSTASLPALSREEAKEMFLLAQAGNEKAREDLIRGNLRLVLSVIKRFDGAYARIYRDRMESTIEVYDRSTGGTISGKKIIPIAAGCWANDSVRESVLSNIQVFCDQLDVVELCFNVQDGEITNMFS